MIKKVSELLRALIEHEVEALGASEITHAPTIGEMYEGLSAELLDMALPLEDTSLKIVRGFIRPNKGGRLSSEIDCMIVVGEGEQVPRTTKYIYPVDQVLVTLEVKKTLTRGELSKTIRKLNNFKRLKQPFTHNAFSEEAFARTIGKRPILAGTPDVIGEDEDLLADTVITNANLPLRIILDYTGYKTSKGLLTAFFDVVAHLSEKDKNGTIALPGFWPDLIVSPNFEVVKVFGAPYSAQRVKHEMPLFAVSRSQFGVVFLESILWRLSSYLDRFLPIYSDFAPPTLAVVFSMTIAGDEGKFAYIFPEHASDSILQIDLDEQPKTLSLNELKVALMFNGIASIPLDDSEVLDGLELTAEEFEAASNRLQNIGVCFQSGNAIFGVYNTLAVGLDRGTPFCGENCRGVLMRKMHKELVRAAISAGQKSLPFVHITTRDPLDFSEAVATKSEISTEVILTDPGLLDVLRYRSTQVARKLLDREQVPH